MRFASLACTLAVVPTLVLAQPSPDSAEAQTDEAAARAADSAAFVDSMAKLESRLQYQQGLVQLAGGIASVNVPAGFRYLDPENANRVLVDAWGNPPGGETLGMLVPADVSPLSPDGWGVVISYRDDGHVKDDDAAKIDYDDLLKEIQESARAENREREKEGYQAVEIVGWARPPRYDQAARKLYWAKELRFGDAAEHTLNYDLRVLGRSGVLVLNAVGSMSQLPDIERRMQEIIGFVDFNDGHRYADFTPGVDKVAAYGIGALVAGKLAAKAGFFKMAIAALVAGKKFVLLGLLALGGLLRGLLSRKARADGGA